MPATHLGTSGVRHLTETVGVKADQFFIGQHRETKKNPSRFTQINNLQVPVCQMAVKSSIVNN